MRLKTFLLPCALALLPSAVALAQPVGPRSVWNIGERGAFVMSSLRDGRGCYWFGTEDQGVWRYDPGAPGDKAWQGFTDKDGLGDANGYAIAEDEQGRIWVGHQSHGVSVWNGRDWRNYDITSGPLGERVFDIAVSPRDGNVWIATNRGLAIYDTDKNLWRYEGRFSGLPSDQIQALAFASDGTVFVGAQCDGLAIGSPRNNYSKWQSVHGSDEMPLYATGEGLPSDVINDVLVAGDDTVYVATGYGLARSDDGGQNWAYLRGQDWRARLEGRTFAPAIPPQPPIDTLTEDTVTTLAEDAAGNIWLGHPTKGVEVRAAGAASGLGGGVVEASDPKLLQARRQKFDQQLQEARARGESARLRLDKAGRPVGVILPVKVPDLSQQEKTDYVTSILPIEGEAPLVCGAGSGVIQLGAQLATLPLRRSHVRDVAAPAVAQFPAAAPAPEAEQLKAWAQTLRKEASALRFPGAVFEGDDWKTKGDWMGRYGTRYAQLCAMQAPFDHFVINDLSYRAVARLGVHPYKDGATFAQQGVRHWLHRKRWDDERVLYNPLLGYRRQADIDDNGEAYSLHYEGPDLWMGVRVPAGAQRVSLYFFNKDGHEGQNRVRDYLIDIKRGSEDLLAVEGAPVLARARVQGFWGGVYKSFVVQGPGDYFFIVRKNNSFNTALQGLFIDKLSGPPTDFEGRRDIWLGQTRYDAPHEPQQQELERAALLALGSNASAAEAAIELWHAANETAGTGAGAHGNQTLRLWAYRAVSDAVARTPAATDAGAALLESWRWQLRLWPPQDRAAFEAAMQRGWDSYAAINPEGARAPR